MSDALRSVLGALASPTGRLSVVPARLATTMNGVVPHGTAPFVVVAPVAAPVTDLVVVRAAIARTSVCEEA